MTEKSRRSVTLDYENNQYLTEHDNASALVNDLVEQYRTGPGKQTAALELQIQQKQRVLEDAEEKVARVRQEIQELRELKTSFEKQEQTRLSDARETLNETPKQPDNPAIQRWAGELDMQPAELVEELQ